MGSIALTALLDSTKTLYRMPLAARFVLRIPTARQLCLRAYLAMVKAQLIVLPVFQVGRTASFTVVRV